jgi:hypothetical protein
MSLLGACPLIWVLHQYERHNGSGENEISGPVNIDERSAAFDMMRSFGG